MAASGLLVNFYRWRGDTIEPRRPIRILTRHATKVVPRAIFYDEDGVPINLTGCTVRYTLMHPATGALIVNRFTATLENQTTNPGEAYYQLLAGQVAQSLECWESWDVDYGGSVTETFPVGMLPQVVRIIDDVDGV